MTKKQWENGRNYETNLNQSIIKISCNLNSIYDICNIRKHSYKELPKPAKIRISFNMAASIISESKSQAQPGRMELRITPTYVPTRAPGTTSQHRKNVI